jgi:Ran-binding protein 3
MPSSPPDDGATFNDPESTESSILEPDKMIDSNHELPARMADAEHHEPTQTHKDDPATVAASEELKQTSLSDRATVLEKDPLEAHTESVEEDKDMGEPERLTTPETNIDDVKDEEMKERITSPKKKRGRDQDEDSQEVADEKAEEGSDGSTSNGRRTTTSEPEKKRRPRDTSEDYAKTLEKSGEVKVGLIPTQFGTSLTHVGYPASKYNYETHRKRNEIRRSKTSICPRKW